MQAFAPHLAMYWEASIVLAGVLSGLPAWQLWIYSSPGLAFSSGDPPGGLRPYPVACTVGAALPVEVRIKCEVAEQLSLFVLCDQG